jgi:hypothetical protein
MVLFSLTRDVTAIISIGQSIKSLILLNAIIDFLGMGYLISSKKTVKEIRISKISSVSKLIIQLNKHKLYGAKYLDFLDFSAGVEIIIKKEHLTEEGKIKIIKISSGMNQRRKEF